MSVTQSGPNSSFSVQGDFNDIQGHYYDYRTQHITQSEGSTNILQRKYAYVPPLPISPRFTGQERHLKQIRKYFSPRENQAPEKRCLLLHGKGGVGKTQIGLKYAQENSDRFWRIFWVDASSKETTELSLKAIAADPEAVAAGIEASPTAVLRWLSGTEHDWLLIYDNADGDPNDIDGYMPPGTRGNLLLTSRNPNMERFVASPDASVEVDSMGEEDATSLLLKWVTPKTSEESATEVERLARAIVKELYCLPLAVDQAGAAIQSGLCSITDYQNVYSNHRKRLMSDPSFKGASNYGRAVYTTWDLSFTAISAAIAGGSDLITSGAAEIAIFLLEMLPFFHHENISEEIFRRAAEAPVERSANLVKKSYLRNLTSKVFRKKERTQIGHTSWRELVPRGLLQLDGLGNWDALFFRDGIRVLISCSLIKKSASGNMYSLHPLVHSWSRDRMSDDQRKSDRSCSASAILGHSISWGFLAADLAFRRDLVPHIKSYQQHTAVAAKSEYILDNFGLAYHENGLYKDAEELWLLVLQSRKKVLGAEHPDTLKSMANLASTYRGQGRLNEAEETEVEVLELSKKVLGAEHPSTLTSMGNLAKIHRKRGRWNEAEGMEVKVLELRKKVLGAEHPYTLTSMGNLASTYRGQGRLNEAEETQVEVLELSKKVLGAEHPDTLTSMGNLAATYREQGRLNEAEETQVEVLELRKKALGAEHPHTLASMTNLAMTWISLGRVDASTELLREVVDLCMKKFGSGHPKTVLYIEVLEEWTKGSGEASSVVSTASSIS